MAGTHLLDDGALYTAVGHRGMDLCNPLGSDQVDELVALLEPAPEARALDLGCGKGELLIRLAERAGCRGVGVDINELLLAEGRAAVDRRAPGLVELQAADARSFPVTAGSFDIAAALGASHALGGTAATLEALARAAAGGGRVALGEGFWRRPPADDELAALGMAGDDMMSLDRLVAACDAAGLDTEAVLVTRDEDFDRYEWHHHRNLQAHLRAHPGDDQAARLWQRRLRWRDAYLRAGRNVFGFAVIVARRPAT